MVTLVDDRVVPFLDDYCGFGEDRVYLLMAIARTKENPELTGSTEVVFREVVKDEEDVRRKVDKLRSSTENYRSDSGDQLTFRLYVTANARNTVDAYFNFRSRMNGWVKDRLDGDDEAARKFKRVDSYWKSELQKPAARDETRFIIDFDGDWAIGVFREMLEDETEVIVERETPNGTHVVTEPFDYTDVALLDEEDIEIKTDGMLFLAFLTERDRGENS